MVYTVRFFPLQNAVRFIILTYLVPVLFTFLYTGCAKIKKNNSGAKRLRASNVQNSVEVKLSCTGTGVLYRPYDL